MKPICFKIRGGVEREDGSRGSTNIGKMAGKGYLGSEDKSFTVLATQDQYLFAGQGNNQSTYDNKPPMTTRKLKYLSLFSGIEAASVAWHPLGFEPIGFAEIEPFPSAVLKHRFPNTPNYGDITKWKEWNLTPGAADIVCAGSPCQSFSVAGLRQGMDDPRGNLALITLGLVEFLQPKWFIWENVPGVLTSNGGRDFAALLTALGDIGYGWSYRVLDAVHFGVPQRRRRVWLVATRHPRGWAAASAVLFDEQSLSWNPAKGISSRSRLARASKASIDENGLHNTVGTICADSHPGGYSGQDAYTGRLIPTEPVAFRKSTRAQSTEHPETWVDDGKANTLNVHDQGDIHTTHAVVDPQAFAIREDSKADTFHAKPVDTALCVNALQPSPQSQHAQNFVVQHCADVAPTVTQSGPPFSRTGNSRVEAEALVTCGTPAVRRLTVTEVTRLQGFPDGWTQIPWKGKPAEECPDGPQYKAIGNSWAVPCARWIGERLAMVDEIISE
jgi:DNA (cytosine-5)-methyltransferase 1